MGRRRYPGECCLGACSRIPIHIVPTSRAVKEHFPHNIEGFGDGFTHGDWMRRFQPSIKRHAYTLYPDIDLRCGPLLPSICSLDMFESSDKYSVKERGCRRSWSLPNMCSVLPPKVAAGKACWHFRVKLPSPPSRNFIRSRYT